MTVQEAYAELISIRNHIEDGYLTHLSYGGKADKQEEYTIKAYNVAINALENQIPKKPIKSDGKIRYSEVFKCPNCSFEFSGRVLNYCYRCGQALDWSDRNG